MFSFAFIEDELFVIESNVKHELCSVWFVSFFFLQLISFSFYRDVHSRQVCFCNYVLIRKSKYTLFKNLFLCCSFPKILFTFVTSVDFLYFFSLQLLVIHLMHAFVWNLPWKYGAIFSLALYALMLFLLVSVWLHFHVICGSFGPQMMSKWSQNGGQERINPRTLNVVLALVQHHA